MMSGEQILRILFIRRWWIVVTTIVGALAGMTLAMVLPHVYEARAQVIVSMAESTDVSAAESATYIDDMVPTVLEVSRSNDFANEVAEDPGIARSPDEIRDSLEFTLVADTSVIEIHAQDQNLVQARVIADRAAQTISTSFLTDRLGSVSSMDVSVLQKAENFADGVFPNSARFLGLGALAGLVLGLLLAPIRHGLDSRIRDFGEMKGILGSELLAVRMRRPSGAIRRQAANTGASTSISGLLARLDLTGRRRGSTIMTLCGVSGTGNQLAADLVETAAASGMRCALVSADPAALRTSHYRELSQVSGISVVDASSLSGESLLLGRALADALCAVLADYDLVICLSSDLASRPQTCSFLELSDFAVVVTGPQPLRADLRSTQELLRVSEIKSAGFILVDPTPDSDSESKATDLDEDVLDEVGLGRIAEDSPAPTPAGSNSVPAEPATEELDMVPTLRTSTTVRTPMERNNEMRNATGGQP